MQWGLRYGVDWRTLKKQSLNHHLIYIEWEDAVANQGWKDLEEADKWFEKTRMTVKEVGWVFKETKEYIALYARRSNYGDKDGEEDIGLLQKIPKTWIRKKKILRI